MVGLDIDHATAENRRRKKGRQKIEDRRNHRTKYNGLPYAMAAIISLFTTLGRSALLSIVCYDEKHIAEMQTHCLLQRKNNHLWRHAINIPLHKKWIWKLELPPWHQPASAGFDKFCRGYKIGGLGDGSPPVGFLQEQGLGIGTGKKSLGSWSILTSAKLFIYGRPMCGPLYFRPVVSFFFFLLLSSSFFFFLLFFRRLISAVADWISTIHGVALLRI